VLRQFDIRAAAYLELVENMESQEAFMIALDEFRRHAWLEHTGYPLETLSPMPGDRQFEAITRRVAHWLHESYKRLIPAPSGRSSIEEAEPTHVDIAVITIREDEFRAVLHYLTQGKPIKHGNRSYMIGSVTAQNGDLYRLAVLRSVEQGHNAAQDAARDIIQDLDARWLALVGIGGAISDTEFTLGDVVVASRLHDFTVSALIEDSPTQFANQGGPMKKEVQDLVALLPGLRLGEWNTEAAIGLKCPRVDMEPDHFYGSNEWKQRTERALNERFGPRATR
jgi:hypothetical protein